MQMSCSQDMLGVVWEYKADKERCEEKWKEIGREVQTCGGERT